MSDMSPHNTFVKSLRLKQQLVLNVQIFEWSSAAR